MEKTSFRLLVIAGILGFSAGITYGLTGGGILAQLLLAAAVLLAAASLFFIDP